MYAYTTHIQKFVGAQKQSKLGAAFYRKQGSAFTQP